MTGKDLKRLSRSDLLEMLLELSKENDTLRMENQELQQRLEDRKINIEKFGSLAEAALHLNGVFEAAQAACEQYTENIQYRSANLQEYCAQLEQETKARCNSQKAETEAQCEAKLTETDTQCAALLAQTQAQCAELTSRAQEDRNAFLAQLQEERNAVIARTQTECDAMLAQARAKSEEILTQSQRNSAGILREARKQAKAMLDVAGWTGSEREAYEWLKELMGET